MGSPPPTILLEKPCKNSPSMDKAKVIWIAMMLIMSSCYESDKYKRVKYNLVIDLNPWMTIDVNKNVVAVKFDDFQYTDTLILSTSELDKIENSFNQNKIAQIEGERH